MERDPASILDIVLACRRLTRFVEGRTREDLDRDELLQFAVLHATALIGEAAKWVARHGESEWKSRRASRLLQRRRIGGYPCRRQLCPPIPTFPFGVAPI